MPEFTVGKIQNALNDRGKPLKGSRVHVLGVAYKSDIDDVRESPALDIIHILQRRGAIVSYTDPYVPSISADGWSMKSDPMFPAVADADCAVIVTNHSEFDYDALVGGASLIVDTRNALGWSQSPKVVRLSTFLN
jgi:UDP-N-acetyl-D-glucosamine dehydrogenase